MGQRKGNSNNSLASSSDNMPCSSRAKLLSKDESSHLLNSSELKPLSLGFDVADKSVKRSFAHPHHNLGPSIFLKRSRHYFGQQYSRRNSGNHANASTSCGKLSSPREEKLPIKFTTQSGRESGWYTGNREKAFSRPERFKLSSSIMDALSSDAAKVVCGICQKLLRHELAVVAVLACSHVYHADCLEQRTSHRDRQDPPCPLCTGLLSQVDGNSENDPQQIGKMAHGLALSGPS